MIFIKNSIFLSFWGQKIKLAHFLQNFAFCGQTAKKQSPAYVCPMFFASLADLVSLPKNTIQEITFKPH